MTEEERKALEYQREQARIVARRLAALRALRGNAAARRALTVQYEPITGRTRRTT